VSWLSSILARVFKRPQTDAVNIALVNAYDQLEYREREHLVGRLADNAFGIQRQPVYTFSRWQPCDRDELKQEVENGHLLRLGYLIDSMKSDGLISGLMDTRTSGLLRRPVLYAGDPFLVERLQGREPTYNEEGDIIDPGEPGLWVKMAPTSELAAILHDGILAGVGVGELVVGQEGLPVLRHLDLHWLRYSFADDQWIYQAPGGTYVVKPGDGRWVLFTPYGSHRPWAWGKWYPLAWPFISKAGTNLDRLRWQGQLADPLKVIQASERSTERDRKNLLSFILNKWHRAPGLVTREDEKAYLIESNGRGYEIYEDSEDRADRAIQYTLSGQTVTGDGNKGFSSGDIFNDIADNLIQGTADAASDCVFRDILAPWACRFWGTQDAPRVSWDVRSPTQRKAEAEALSEAMDVIAKADSILDKRGQEVDLPAYLKEQRITLPLKEKGANLAQDLMISAGNVQLRLPE
jgi:hypothetical protein